MVKVLVPLVVVALYESEEERLDPARGRLFRLNTLQPGIREQISQSLGLYTVPCSAQVTIYIFKFNTFSQTYHLHSPFTVLNPKTHIETRRALDLRKFCITTTSGLACLLLIFHLLAAWRKCYCCLSLLRSTYNTNLHERRTD